MWAINPALVAHCTSIDFILPSCLDCCEKFGTDPFGIVHTPLVCGFVLVALQCFETQSSTHQCGKHTMIEHSPSWKPTNHPSERKTLISATGDTMEYRAGTDLGKKAWF